MRGAFGKPQGTVARVHIGQPIMSVRSADRYKAQVIEALRRAKFKFPGRQKVKIYALLQLHVYTLCVHAIHVSAWSHLSFALFHRFSSQRNGVSPNSIAHVMKSSVTMDVWRMMGATSNTDQNTVQWLHGKKFKLKSSMNKSDINLLMYAGHLEQSIQ